MSEFVKAITSRAMTDPYCHQALRLLEYGKSEDEVAAQLVELLCDVRLELHKSLTKALARALPGPISLTGLARPEDRP